MAAAGTGALPLGGTVWGLSEGYYVRRNAAPVWTASSDGAEGAVRLEACQRVPFRLPEVEKHDTLFTSEGEKDVLTLTAWGLPATGNAGGCGGSDLWAEWPGYFRDKRIAHLFDNDGPGKKHVLAKAHALWGVAAEQRIVELPGVGPGGDVTDWAAAGHTADEFLTLVRATPVLDQAGLDALAARWGSSTEEPRSRMGGEEAQEEESAEIARPSWPEPLREEAYYGLAGEIVRAIEPHSEADPAALLMQFVMSGLASGEGLIWAVRDEIRERHPIRQGGRIINYEEVVSDPGILDKRLVVAEPEYSRVLQVIERETNTLSAIIRQAWDTGNLRILTKKQAPRHGRSHLDHRPRHPR